MNKSGGVAGIVACLVVLSAGCTDPSVTVYEVPKERSPGTEQSVKGPESMGATEMGQQSGIVQPVSGDVPSPTWEIPDHWEAGTESEMRRGSFQVSGSNGASLDIAVTVFPGDVGGPAANINRWRAQINLPPLTASEADTIRAPITIGDQHGWIVELDGPEMTTHAATVEVAGYSWFFRMSGDRQLAEREREAFRAFLRSVRFE